MSSDLKARLMRRMQTVAKSSPNLSLAGTSDSSSNAKYERYTRVDSLPGFMEMQVQAAAAERFGVENPYFRTHEAIAGATSIIDGREVINFSSYNYLDLNGHPKVIEAATQALQCFGSSVSASRVVSGERPVQRALERAIADFHGAEDCVVMVSGHATNVTCVGHLLGKRDLLVHDSLIHNSIVQGALLSGAERISFKHNDWQALDELLTASRHRYERVLIAIEGLYSMDGDYPDLPRFVEVKRRHQAWILLDEAHSFGVMGPRGAGAIEHFGLRANDVELHMGTLSKTLCSCGGYIAGSSELVEYLKCSAPGFVYSVGLSPPLAAAAAAALELMALEPERTEKLRENGQYFLSQAKSRGLDTGTSAGLSIVPIVCGSSLRAARLSQALLRRGVNSEPIIAPAVEERRARLRFFLSSAHGYEQIDEALQVTVEELQNVKS